MTDNKTHDIFVGNLSFNTTEEQLRQVFSTAGPVSAVRIVSDKDTQKSKGFAFIEFADAATALSAIRNLDGYELNNRKIRVSYSNNSSLRELAKQIGQVIPDNSFQGKSIESALNGMKLADMYDILECVKQLSAEDKGTKLRTILQLYPQLIPAVLEIQVGLYVENLVCAHSSLY